MTFIVGLIAFVGILLALMYFVAFTKRPAYKRAYKQGKIPIDFDPVNSLNEDVSEFADKTKEIFSKIYDATGKKIDGLKRRQIEHIIVDKRIDKIGKPSELAMLRDNAVITEEEFTLLKEELLEQ